MIAVFWVGLGICEWCVLIAAWAVATFRSRPNQRLRLFAIYWIAVWLSVQLAYLNETLFVWWAAPLQCAAYLPIAAVEALF